MTSFTVQGHFLGQLSNITWTDGVLESDNPTLIGVVRRAAAGYEGHVLSTGFADSEHNHLHNPYIAYMLIGHWMAEKQPEIVAGELPEIPEPPEGAVE